MNNNNILLSFTSLGAISAKSCSAVLKLGAKYPKTVSVFTSLAFTSASAHKFVISEMYLSNAKAEEFHIMVNKINAEHVTDEGKAKSFLEFCAKEDCKGTENITNKENLGEFIRGVEKNLGNGGMYTLAKFEQKILADAGIVKDTTAVTDGDLSGFIKLINPSIVKK